MEEKINVEEILKDKSQGTKLYDLLYNIDVELDTISTTDTETVVWCTNETDNNTTCHRGYSEFGTVRGCSDGLQILLPSKEMRDWNKFAWKKEDVLVNKDGDVHIIFERFADDTYCSFVGKYYLWKENNDTEHFYKNERLLTSDFQKAGKDAAQTYISTIEERLGGKLNRETLEVEADVNVGDVVSDDVLYGICKKVDNSNVYCDFGCDSANYNAPITKFCLQKEDINVVMPTNKEAWYKEIEKKHHISIDRNTLEVQPEFKDGDIAFADFGITQDVFIVTDKTNLSEGYYSYVVLNLNTTKTLSIGCKTSFFKENLYTLRFATEEEKQQLIDALAKEGKAWDAEKKQVVDLKPKWTPKPFDRVITRNAADDVWTANIFSHMDSHGEYVTIACVGGYTYCLPYNEDTAKLIGTTKDVEV